MGIRRKIVGAVVAALLAVPLLGAPTAAADVSPQACRAVEVTNPTGGAHIEVMLCYISIGGGWFSMSWSGQVDDIEGDAAGAAANILYTLPSGAERHIAFRADGLGNSTVFAGLDSPGTGLYVRACLINGNTLHDCSTRR